MAETLRVVQALAGAPVGGAENFYTRLVAALAEDPGLSQQAFTRRNPAREAALGKAGVSVQRFRFGGPLDVVDHWIYRRALERLNPDIVMTWMSRASGNTPRGNWRLVNRLGHYYNLRHYRHADHWVGITRGICDYLVREGLPADRITCIGNFADETPLPTPPRGSFDTPSDQPILLAAGRLHENKGFDVLLRALTRVEAGTLWLAGDGPLAAPLKQQARDLGLTERVRFLGWRDDVGALMQAADLFICPSRHEGLGSIVVEAWFRGAPLVATASQGPGELISDGQNGLLTPIDDCEALAAAINRLLRAPGEAQALAEGGAQTYRDRFSRAVITRAYGELYRQLAGHR